MRDLTFYLANTPPLPVPHLDVHILQTDTEAGSTRNYTGLSCPRETRIPFGQDRLREVGHSIDNGFFQAFPGFVHSMCCSTRANTLAIDGEFLSCSVLPPHYRDLVVQEFRRRVTCRSCCWHKYTYGWGAAYTRDKSTCARTQSESVGGAYMRDTTVLIFCLSVHSMWKVRSAASHNCTLLSPRIQGLFSQPIARGMSRQA